MIMLELVEMELRELLDLYEFPGDDTPIVVGSALMALEGKDDNELGTTAVKKLVEALELKVELPMKVECDNKSAVDWVYVVYKTT